MQLHISRCQNQKNATNFTLFLEPDHLPSTIPHTQKKLHLQRTLRKRQTKS